MKSKFCLLALILFTTQVWAENDNRGRAKPNYNPTNLTDAQKRESESFVHEGRSQRIMMEECAGLSEEESKLYQENQQKAYEQFGDKITKGMQACAGNAEVKGGIGLKLSPEMAGAISKAYTMVMGVAGGGMKLTSLDDIAAKKQEEADALKSSQEGTELSPEAQEAQAEADQAAEDAEGKDERDDTDYCKYVAVGTEAIAMVQQTMAQQQMNSVPLQDEGSPQRASLMRVARGYEERAKNAQTQTMGWGVTTGCYAYMMTRPSVSKSAWQNWLKVGASGFMTAVFNGHRKGFKDAAEETKRIANVLPGKGDCNPHTDRDCYCSEPTTMGNPQYCAPYLHQKAIRDPGITMRTSCITNKAEADPKCQCLADDSCLHKGIDTLFKMDGLGGQVNPAYLGDLNNLSSGTVAGALNTDALNRNLSAARNAMRKANEELGKLTPPKSKLSAGELKEAEFLEAQGVPSTLAKAIAASELPKGSSASSTLAGLRSNFIPDTAAQDKSFNASLKDNSSSSGLRPKKAAKKQDAANPFAKYMNQGKGKTSSNGNILHLAQKAEAAAQISNRKESSVFDIISRRYQVSAWRRLELDNDL